jgi:hypothetical protein
MRRVPHMLLVLVLAFALSGAEALATDCCSAECCDEADRREDGRAPAEGDACPVSCPACPSVRPLTPGLVQPSTLPALTEIVSFAWWAPALQPSSSYARGVFLPPRAG